MLDDPKILWSQPVHHRSPKLRVPADAVMGIRRVRRAALVEPGLGGAIAQLPPHRVGAPVLIFLGDEVAALDDKDLRAGVGQRARNGAAASATSNNDDVEGGHHFA